jgi:AdoMet-dependent heme synthase
VAPDFHNRPILVFWETTRACLLACRHCRASAQREPFPNELSTEEGFALVDQIVEFGRPAPILILTGGDCLMRPDITELVHHARERGLHVAISPSVTPHLTDARLSSLREAGVRVASISLDGASPQTHDGIRGFVGHFDATLSAISRLREHGYKVQVNTTVMASNVEEMADVAALVGWHGVSIWEVFFLVNVGRGVETRDLSASHCEDVCHFLVDASRYGFLVRTVEAPFFRRVAAWRREGLAGSGALPPGPLYDRLHRRLLDQLGPGVMSQNTPLVATRDGSGIIFVGYNGDILPSGFLPLSLGNVRSHRLADVYQNHPILQQIRGGYFHGRCGQCDLRQICGGSRARAYAASGDVLGEDPACAYVPPPSSSTVLLRA